MNRIVLDLPLSVGILLTELSLHLSSPSSTLPPPSSSSSGSSAGNKSVFTTDLKRSTAFTIASLILAERFNGIQKGDLLVAVNGKEIALPTSLDVSAGERRADRKSVV